MTSGAAITPRLLQLSEGAATAATRTEPSVSSAGSTGMRPTTTTGTSCTQSCAATAAAAAVVRPGASAGSTTGRPRRARCTRGASSTDGSARAPIGAGRLVPSRSAIVDCSRFATAWATAPTSAPPSHEYGTGLERIPDGGIIKALTDRYSRGADKK